MGIRINKYIGYGFDDLIENDPRIDFEVFEDRREADHEEFNSFVQLIKSDHTEYMLYNVLKKQTKAWSMYDKAIYDSEFGDEKVMLFIHPLSEDWHRRDNIIDYVEEVNNSVEAISSSIRLKSGIYPYSNGDRLYHQPSKEFINERTLSRLKYTETPYVTASGIEIGTYDKIKDDLIPEVPILIKNLAEFVGVKSEYLNDLRPLSYTYWS